MLKTLTAATIAALLPGLAHAACTTETAKDDVTSEEAQSLYDCIEADMHAGYVKGPKRWIPKAHVTDYRSWKKASTAPAAPGFHGERFLVTFVNDTGYDAYTEFKDENVVTPAGTVIAKESFTINKKGRVIPGPLFLMEKVAEGKSPETNDWYYMAVQPNGSPMAVNVMTACNECHMENFGEQDNLGYPAEEVRVSN